LSVRILWGWPIIAPDLILLPQSYIAGGVLPRTAICRTTKC
jgi:hypothetical protein